MTSKYPSDLQPVVVKKLKQEDVMNQPIGLQKRGGTFKNLVKKTIDVLYNNPKTNSNVSRCLFNFILLLNFGHFNKVFWYLLEINS